MVDAGDMINDLLQTQLKESLKKGVCQVTFTKVSGEERVMLCTLNEDLTPPATKEDPLSQKKVRAVNPEVQVVYDVEKDGWRSFRWDSLVAWKDQ
jgi:hypothetical protein